MSDPEASRKAEIERVQEAADRVAKRTSQNFVLDPAKLEQFAPSRVPGESDHVRAKPMQGSIEN